MPRGYRLLALPAAAVALVAAGCGSSASKPYTAAGTAPCLKTKGFTQVTTNAGKVGLIAGFADNGGLRARAHSGNVLTIAFTADAGSVAGTEKAFRSHASVRYRSHMHDIMEAQGNAVLVWTVSPAPKELADVTGCLHP